MGFDKFRENEDTEFYEIIYDRLKIDTESPEDEFLHMVNYSSIEYNILMQDLRHKGSLLVENNFFSKNQW